MKRILASVLAGIVITGAAFALGGDRRPLQGGIGCVDVTDRIFAIKSDRMLKSGRVLVQTCCGGLKLLSDVKVNKDGSVSISGWQVLDHQGKKLKVELKNKTRTDPKSQTMSLTEQWLMVANYNVCFIVERKRTPIKR